MKSGVGQDGDNVLLDDAGFLRFIDPIIGFKPPLLEKLADVFAVEAKIVDIVFDLYGLTKEEREIVEKACEKPVIEEEL